MYVDVERIGASTHTQWVAESGVLDLFLLLGPGPKQVCTGQTCLSMSYSASKQQHQAFTMEPCRLGA